MPVICHGMANYVDIIFQYYLVRDVKKEQCIGDIC